MDQNTTFTDKEAEQVLSGICIPPCPAILTKLMKEMRGDEPDFTRISQLISEDASLAAAMLQTVNSAFYGLRTKATSVQQAIILLGLREVRRLATRILLRDAFSNGSSEVMEQYWESSSSIAQISAYLADHFGFDRDEAYTFALFRDCGMLAMMDSYEDYKPMLPGQALPAGCANVIALENTLHNMNHARSGRQSGKNLAVAGGNLRADPVASRLHVDAGGPRQDLARIRQAHRAHAGGGMDLRQTDCRHRKPGLEHRLRVRDRGFEHHRGRPSTN